MGGSPIAGWFYVYFMENPARKWVRLGTNYRKPAFILGNRSTPKSSCGDLGILHIFNGVYRKSYFESRMIIMVKTNGFPLSLFPQKPIQ
jgi:hypothetical protein